MNALIKAALSQRLLMVVIAFALGSAFQGDKNNLESWPSSKSCQCEKRWEEQRERNRDQDWLNGIIRKHLGQSGVSIGNPPGATK